MNTSDKASASSPFFKDDFIRINKLLGYRNTFINEEDLEFIEDDTYWRFRAYRVCIKGIGKRNRYFSFRVHYKDTEEFYENQVFWLRYKDYNNLNNALLSSVIE